MDDAPTPTALWTTHHHAPVSPAPPTGDDGAMLPTPTRPAGTTRALIGHLDVDAFFAAVEQRDKPSLRGRPVVVGGVGPRGVVATASYEARRFGIHSAMPMAEARRRCPAAAVLAGRFEAYRASSDAVMDVLRAASPAVEQVSLDEAYLELPVGDPQGRVATMRRDIRVTTGLAASVGVGWSKLVAKIASDEAKPDGARLVLDGEQAFLDPLPARRLPGLGPQTQARLARLGITTVGQLRGLALSELTALLGDAHGTQLWQLAQGVDPRTVTPVHETKSVSVEETFDADLVDPVLVETVLTRLAGQVAARLEAAGVSGRTVTIKARHPDFTTVSRSATRAGPTDDARTIARMARTLLSEIDLPRGLRLLGVGCSGLTAWVQDDLFDADEQPPDDAPAGAGPRGAAAARPSETAGHGHWLPGQDVEHDDHGPGWVWGSGAGRVTVRFETRLSPPGPVRTFPVDEPGLRGRAPEPVGSATPRSDAPPHRPAADRPPPRDA